MEPNDIGLAKYEDVGDVNALETNSKTVVGAINELNNKPAEIDLNIVNGNNTGAVRSINAGSDYIMGTNSIAVGSNTRADGSCCHAEGANTIASYAFSHAEGDGSKATGKWSHAEGSKTAAEGHYSHAQGNVTTARYLQDVIGQFNVISSASNTAYDATKEAFIIGNGTSTSNRGNAFKVNFDGNVFADGTYSSPCADYAELFEWEDSNPNNEDRVGYFVTLINGMIKLSSDFESPLGVTSANPAILGDSAALHWQGKYVTDDFGRIRYHEVETDMGIEIQPMLNPEYDPSQEYIPRSQRPEWSAVGIMGKLPVRDDGTASVGDIVRPTDGGIATKSINTGYQVLNRISNNVILIWVR